MKHYEIQYLLHNQSVLFEPPRKVIAKSIKEKDDVLHKCEQYGYVVIECRPFDPIPPEERFYA